MEGGREGGREGSFSSREIFWSQVLQTATFGSPLNEYISPCNWQPLLLASCIILYFATNTSLTVLTRGYAMRIHHLSVELLVEFTDVNTP